MPARSTLLCALLLGVGCGPDTEGKDTELTDTAGDTQSDVLPDPFVSFASTGSLDLPDINAGLWVGGSTPHSIILGSPDDLCKILADFASSYESIVDGNIESGGSHEEGRGLAESHFRNQLIEPWVLLTFALQNPVGLEESDWSTVGLRAGLENRTAIREDTWAYGVNLSHTLVGQADSQRIGGSIQGEFYNEEGISQLSVESEFTVDHCATEFTPDTATGP
jgi:hypothetical protein